MGQRCFAQARRSREQDVVESLAALVRRRNGHPEDCLDALLPDEISSECGRNEWSSCRSSSLAAAELGDPLGIALWRKPRCPSGPDKPAPASAGRGPCLLKFLSLTDDTRERPANQDVEPIFLIEAAN
jgi:hypothetical protein